MNILFLHSLGMNLHGGIERISLGLDAEFTARGHQAFFLAILNANKATAHPEKQFFFPDAKRDAPGNREFLRNLLIERQIDFVIYQVGDYPDSVPKRIRRMRRSRHHLPAHKPGFSGNYVSVEISQETSAARKNDARGADSRRKAFFRCAKHRAALSAECGNRGALRFALRRIHSVGFRAVAAGSAPQNYRDPEFYDSNATGMRGGKGEISALRRAIG